MPARFKEIQESISIDVNMDSNVGCWPLIIILLPIFIFTSYYSGYVWMSISGIMLFLCVKASLDGKSRLGDFQKWLEEMDGSKIFFYPTNKKQQLKIQQKLALSLDSNIKQIYYDGPKLVGDIQEEYFMGMYMGRLNADAPNLPKFLRISDGRLEVICTLREFVEENWDEAIINQLIHQMNIYGSKEE